MARDLVRSSSAGAQSPHKKRLHIAEILNESFTKEELDFYEINRGCAVHCTVNRILRSLSTRMNAGGLPFAPPIISRIYQEISNGLLAYNQAIKLKEVSRIDTLRPPARALTITPDARRTTTRAVSWLHPGVCAQVPVPFVYVQYNALLMLLFTLITPIAIGAFTTSQSCSQGEQAGLTHCSAFATTSVHSSHPCHVGCVCVWHRREDRVRRRLRHDLPLRSALGRRRRLLQRNVARGQ